MIFYYYFNSPKMKIPYTYTVCVAMKHSNVIDRLFHPEFHSADGSPFGEISAERAEGLDTPKRLACYRGNGPVPASSPGLSVGRIASALCP